jgi:N-acetylmuramoyl-L-alanine amidase
VLQERGVAIIMVSLEGGGMRTDLVRTVQRLLLLVIVGGLAAVTLSSWNSARAGVGPAWLIKLAGPVQNLTDRQIGIVAGHSGNDSGAVCIDGLTEESVNQTIADLVAEELKRHGARVDVLKEFDERLQGYRADAFVSIHADSCRTDRDSLTGYKVASLEGGSEASAQLANCLWKTYTTATGLKPHEATITSDMRDYHAFREIAPDTPAAIIETGFLYADRAILTQHPERPAAGIAEGIECFLAPPQEPQP